MPADLKSLARAYTDMSLQALCGVIQNGESENARVTAALGMLDRGWGKPASTVEHTGKDGADEIRITIRNIMEGKK